MIMMCNVRYCLSKVIPLLGMILLPVASMGGVSNLHVNELIKQVKYMPKERFLKADYIELPFQIEVDGEVLYVEVDSYNNFSCRRERDSKIIAHGYFALEKDSLSAARNVFSQFVVNSAPIRDIARLIKIARLENGCALLSYKQNKMAVQYGRCVIYICGDCNIQRVLELLSNYVLEQYLTFMPWPLLKCIAWMICCYLINCFALLRIKKIRHG